MADKKLPTGDDEPQVITKEAAHALLTQTPNPDVTIPAVDLRTGYLAKRRAIANTSLDEGQKLYDLGCIRRGQSPTHFIFRAPNEAKTRHDLHVVFDDRHAESFWHAVVCSCPTGRQPGDPCWHKGAVRAFLANNEHIRHANILLGLPLA